MASGLYIHGKEALLDGTITWTTDDIRSILVDTAAYTVNLTTHDFLDDVAGASRISTSAASLASKTGTHGVADATDKTHTAVTGASVEAIVLYLHTGTEGTSNLLAYIDGVSVTPNGGDITIQWDAAGVFAL